MIFSILFYFIIFLSFLSVNNAKEIHMNSNSTKAIISTNEIANTNNRNLKNDKSKSKGINKFIYYIADGEGLISQVRRADLLWNIANSIDRVVYALDFISGHFLSKAVSLCNIFDMPKNFTCISDKTQDDIFKEYHCVCPLSPGSSGAGHFKGYPKDIDTERYFDYKTVECVAGGFRTGDGIYPKFVRMPLIHPIRGNIFHENYLKFLPKLKKLLGLTGKDEYNAIHWRRDDGLKRCNAEDRNLVDCATVEEFVVRIKNQTNHYNDKQKKTVTYISTDERKENNIDYLEEHGIKVFRRDLAPGMDFYLKKSDNLKLDTFVLELLLQVDSNYYFAWGRSSVHHFVCEVRVLRKSPRYITVIDDKLISDYLVCKGALR